jgi:hypothetical protein
VPKDSPKFRSKYRYLTVFLCLILGLFLSFILGFNHLFKIAVEKTLTSALGVSAQIDSLNFNPLAGNLKFERLEIENPVGFSSPYLLAIKNFEIQFLPSSLLTPTIEVQNLRLNHLEIYIEQGFALNLTSVIRHLQQNTKPPELPQKETKPEIKIKAQLISIDRVELHAQLPFWQRSLQLPNLKLQNIQTQNGEGITISELLFQIFSKTLAPVLRDNLLELPKSLLELLKRSLK